MTGAEIASQILRKLTGGSKVCTDIDPDIVEEFVNDAFLEVRPWYDEPPLGKTFNLQPTVQRAGFVEFLEENLPVKSIRKVIPIKLEQDYTGDIVRDLLLLPASPIDTQSIIEHAYWEMTWPMIKHALGRELRWRFDRKNQKLFVDNTIERVVTVIYIPEPQDVEQVTWDKALTWIWRMAEAHTKEAIAIVRGKFSGGALRFNTDAQDMRSSAQEMQRDLREQLKDLFFYPAIRGESGNY